MNDSGKVILIGGSGMLGQRLIMDLPHDILVTSSRADVANHILDLSGFKEDDLEFVNENDTILLAAAVSSPDICKRDPEYARAVNVTGTTRAISYCLDKGARVVFFSSDTVYGDCSEPVTENTPLSPAGYYGEMKSEVEELFNTTDNFIALRLSYVVSAQDKFTRYLLSCAANDKDAEIYHPLYRNAVWIGDVVSVIKSLIDQWPVNKRALNVGGPSLVSRIDMADAFSSYIDQRLRYKIIEPEPEFYTARPVTISMNTKLLANYIGEPPSSLQAAYCNEFNMQEKPEWLHKEH